MDRFLCLLLIGTMLACGAAAVYRPAEEPAQTVFFSLLFPQLVPGYEMEQEDTLEADGAWPMPFDRARLKAVLL